MNLLAALSIASTFAVATLAAECDTKLNAAAATTAREKCEDTSGFDFGLSAPTPEILATFCKTEACMTVLSDVKSLGLPECTIYGKQLYKDVLNPLEKACKPAASMANSTGKAGASKHSHGSGSMDSSDDDSAMQNPSNHTTSTPAPAPTGAASSIAASSVVTASIAVLSLATALV